MLNNNYNRKVKLATFLFYWHPHYILSGDVIFHLTIIESYKTNQGYNFKECFEDIKELINDNDIAIFNLDGNVDETKKVSGYPRFNSPLEVIDALKWTGFNGVITR